MRETESNKTNNYITHPAFIFGDKSLTGIWVAKFEASSDKSCTADNWSVNSGCDITSLQVKSVPNVTSWRGIRVSTLDVNARAMNNDGNIYGFIKNEVDTHVMKNLEWGAVAYLSQSKYGKYGNPNYEGANKEVYQNKSSNFITGMSNGSPSTTTANTQVTYDVQGTGTGASTTGTIYGIYDMSGGATEYVMGVIKSKTGDMIMSGQTDSINSGFTGRVYQNGEYKAFSGRSLSNDIYYDLYEFGQTYNDDAAYARYKIGDATTEIKGWYSDNINIPIYDNPFFGRGGRNIDDNIAGIFYSGRSGGHSNKEYSFRPVLVEQ